MVQKKTCRTRWKAEVLVSKGMEEEQEISDAKLMQALFMQNYISDWLMLNQLRPEKGKDFETT